jgi:hypothetical protein
MKVPRVEDFDPKAAPPLGSPMDNLPRIEKPLMATPQPSAVVPVAPESVTESVPSGKEKTTGDGDTMPPRYRDTTVSNHRDTTIPRNHDTVIPRNRDTTVSGHHDTVTAVYRAVKEFGKEAATHRFTRSEKKAIADLLYTLKQRDLRTTENEVARIGVNFVIQDYQQNGENSILVQILKMLST